MKKGYKKFKRVLGILLMVSVLNGSLGLDSLAVRAAEGTSDAAQVEKVQLINVNSKIKIFYIYFSLQKGALLPW